MKQNRVNRWVLSLWLALFPFSSHAGETEVRPWPQPPQLPNPIEGGEAIEPEVTIIRRKGASIEEYRVNGFLYAIKVMPDVGAAYYFIDSDGDGTIESRIGELEEIAVPHWVIFSW